MSASSKKKLRKEQETAALTQKQQQELKEAKKLKIYSVTFVVAIVLILAIGLGILGYGWINNSGILLRNSVAITIGDHEISTAELNYFYIDTINAQYSSWYETYGSYMSAYLSMMGLDLYSPLDEQMYSSADNQTWADYFLENAINEAVAVYAIYDTAVAAGYQMTEDDELSVDNAMKSMQDAATSAQYSNLGDYLKAFYGNGATEEGFRNYLSVVALAGSYENSTYAALTYTDDALKAYSDEHYIDFSSFTYSTFQVNYNDFLDQVCTAEEGDTEHTHTEEEEAAALAAAAEVADLLVEASPVTHVAFEKAVKNQDVYKDKTTVSVTENVAQLYTRISNTEIADWLADSERKVGDMTVVANTTSTTNEDGTVITEPYAYTVVLFLERNDNDVQMVNIRHILKAFTDDSTSTAEPTEAQKASALDAITKLQEDWLANGGTQEGFIARVADNTADSSSAATGGLFSDVYPGLMLPTIDDWCFAEGRKAGDYGIVETEHGYHLIYFVDHCDYTYRNHMIENTLRNTEFDAWRQAIIDATKLTIKDTSKIDLHMTLVG